MESDSQIFAHIFFIVIINMLKKHRTNEMQTKEVWDSSKTSLLQFARVEHWSLPQKKNSWTLKPTLHSIFLPCLDNRDAMNRVFPPGAAQQSMMVSPGCGSTTETTRPEIRSFMSTQASNNFLKWKLLSLSNKWMCQEFNSFVEPWATLFAKGII